MDVLCQMMNHIQKKIWNNLWPREWPNLAHLKIGEQDE
jgi:hypothetical protein